MLFPYKLGKLQNYLCITLNCSETKPTDQPHRQAASSGFLAVQSQRVVGPAKRILFLLHTFQESTSACSFLLGFNSKVNIQKLHVIRLKGNGIPVPALTELSSTGKDRLQGPGSFCLYMALSSTVKNVFSGRTDFLQAVRQDQHLSNYL